MISNVVVVVLGERNRKDWLTDEEERKVRALGGLLLDKSMCDCDPLETQIYASADTFEQKAVSVLCQVLDVPEKSIVWQNLDESFGAERYATIIWQNAQKLKRSSIVVVIAGRRYFAVDLLEFLATFLMREKSKDEEEILRAPLDRSGDLWMVLAFCPDEKGDMRWYEVRPIFQS